MVDCINLQRKIYTAKSINNVCLNLENTLRQSKIADHHSETSRTFYSHLTTDFTLHYDNTHRFKDEIECDRIVLRAFQTPHKVSAFRSSKPDYLQQLIQEAEDSANRGAESAEGMSGKKGFGLLAKAAGFRRRSTQEKIAAQQQAQQQQQQQVPSIQSQLGGKVAKALEKAEARKRKRLARQAQVSVHVAGSTEMEGQRG